MNNSVVKVVNRDLCCSCGACVELCGQKAISLTFSKGIFAPSVNDQLCSDCGRCLTICPSAGVDAKYYYEDLDLFSKTEKDCYVAFSKNNELRHEGTSGGVVSTLVYELLRNGDYKKAYLLDYEAFNGDRAKIKAVNELEGVVKAARSKYIPASIEDVISDILHNNIDSSIIVATPCQLLAIKQCLRLKKKPEDNLLFIGLFCDKTLNYNIYDFYKHKFGEFDSLHFRDKDGGGWPGDTVLIQNGEKVIASKMLRMSVKPFFQLNRCRYCFDKLNQLSDISCGDCYIQGEESKSGKSSIVVRTKKGKEVLSKCMGVLDVKASGFMAIKNSQRLQEKLMNYKRSLTDGLVFVNLPVEMPIASKCLFSSEGHDLEKIKLGAEANASSDYEKIESLANGKLASKKTTKFVELMKRLFLKHANNGDSPMVLIDNAGFENKGAELMLQSVVQMLKENVPNVRIVVPREVFYENPSYCLGQRIYPMRAVYGGVKRKILRFLYCQVIRKPWYITPDQIDVVLDAGGFQFGDQWKPSKKTVLSKKRYYSSFTKKNRKIVFLPQAFGPFEEPLSIQLMKTVHHSADLIFAREPVSYMYLERLFGDDTKIKMAPDFTCLSHRNSRLTVNIPGEYVVLVPNVRMVTHTGKDVSSVYSDFLYEIVRFLVDKGEKVVLLNHEGPDDEKLLVALNERFSNQLLMLSNLDALEVKRIIGGAKLLVSSRFHGVVSGLTQNVPTLCTSWSHKYSELLKEHGCDNNILSVNDLEGAKGTIEEALLHPITYSSKPGCIEEIKKESVDMWQQVFRLLGWA